MPYMGRGSSFVNHMRMRERMRRVNREKTAEQIAKEKQQAKLRGVRYLSPIQKKIGARLIA